MLTHILSSGTTSRLYRRLVVEEKVASAVSGYYQGTALDPTRMTFSLSPAEGVSLPQLEAAFDKELESVVANGITDGELARAKSRMVADMIYAQDNQTALARIYGAALTSGLTVDNVYTWTDRIEKVETAAVAEAARRWLDKRRSVTGYLTPKDTPAEGKRS